METRPLLALTLALAACANQSAINPGGDDAIVGDPASIEGNVQRLVDLEVFSVLGLVVDLPAEAMHCYGPCPGWEEEYPEVAAALAERLQSFADAAEVAAANAAPPGAYVSFDRDAAAEDLESLEALEIVTIGSFLEVQPANDPNCYNLPCEEDIAAAEDENCLRAARLEAIVAATSDLRP